MSYLGHIEGRDVLTMRRTEWHDLVGHEGKPVAFDVRSTPMRSITNVSSVIATIADHFTPGTARISIFRDDPKDIPQRVNTDHYKVWTDLSAYPGFPGLITAASTSNNENLQTFIKDTVLLMKEGPGPDHWLTTLPSSVQVLLKSDPCK